MYDFAPNSVDNTIHVFLRDSTTFLAKTGIAFNSAGASAYYERPLGTPTAITLATLASITTAHSDGGFLEVDATNMPGLYRLDLPDAVVASGAPFATITLKFTGVLTVSVNVFIKTSLATIAADVAAILLDTGTDGVVVATGSKSGYSLAADQSGVTVGTVNAIAANAVNASALNADAVTEIVAGFLAASLSEPSGAPASWPVTVQALLEWMGARSINPSTQSDILSVLRNFADTANIATANIAGGATTTKSKWT